MLKKFLLFILLFLIFVLCLLVLIKSDFFNSTNVIQDSSVESETVEEKIEPINFTMTAIGDTLCHNTQYWDAYNSSTKQYDFSYVYDDIKDYTSSADITIGSLETTFAGEDRGYRNGMHFSFFLLYFKECYSVRLQHNTLLLSTNNSIIF